MLQLLQCLLCGLLGMFLALLSMLVIVIAGLAVVSWQVSYRSQGEIGWDPISLAEHEPLVGALLLLFCVSFLALGFVRGYRFRARHIGKRRLA